MLTRTYNIIHNDEILIWLLGNISIHPFQGLIGYYVYYPIVHKLRKIK